MLQVDLNTCNAYIGEECEYSGDRLGKIDINILLEVNFFLLLQYETPLTQSSNIVILLLKFKYLQRSMSHLLEGSRALVLARLGPNLSSRTELTTSTLTARRRNACSSHPSRLTVGWLEDQRLLLLLPSAHEQHLSTFSCSDSSWSLNGNKRSPRWPLQADN